MSRRLLLAISVLALASVVGVVVALTTRGDTTKHSYVSPTTALTPSTQPPYQCAGDDSCKENLVKQLVASDEVPKALALLRSWAQEGAPCHEWAHVVGWEAAQRYDIATAVSFSDESIDRMCHFGYVHGLLQKYADVPSVDLSVASRTCTESNRSKSWVEQCLHGLGHALVRKHPGDVGIALETCSTLDKKESNWCASGVFMEHAVAATTSVIGAQGSMFAGDEMARSSLTKEQWSTLCDETPARYVQSCANKAALLWGPSVELGAKGYQTIARHCESLAQRVVKERTEILRTCGSSLGEWIRNTDPQGVPDTPENAVEVSKFFASACGPFSAEIVEGCNESITFLYVLAQVGAGFAKDTLVNLCPYVAPERRAACELSFNDAVAESSGPASQG